METEQALPVVFAHGLRVSGTMWRQVMDVVGRRHPVAAPDLPGHGNRRGEPFTMHAATDTVAATIDSLGGRALVVGLSLGGYVGIATAARHPERVAGLVAMGCTLRRDGLGGAFYRLAGRLASRDPDRAGRLSERGFRRSLPPALAEDMVAGGLSCEVIPQAVAAVAAMRPPLPPSRYPGPVWLVNGARDPFRRHEREFRAACRDGRLAVRPRRGHLTCLIDTHAVARTVTDAAAAARSPESRSGGEQVG